MRRVRRYHEKDRLAAPRWSIARCVSRLPHDEHPNDAGLSFALHGIVQTSPLLNPRLFPATPTSLATLPPPLAPENSLGWDPEKSNGRISNPRKYSPVQKTTVAASHRCRARSAFAVTCGRGGEASPTMTVMNRRGTEFTLVQVEPGVWNRRFQVGEIVTTGKTEASLISIAAHQVKQRIDQDLEVSRSPAFSLRDRATLATS